MLIYLKYLAIWLFFMALIVGVTLLVPKIAAKIDKVREQNPKQPQDHPTDTADATDEADTTDESEVTDETDKP